MKSASSEFGALSKLAVPLALAQAGQALMGMVDTAVMGRLDATSQAGAGLGNTLSFTCLFFGMGVVLILDPLVSQAIGAQNPTLARNHYWQGVWLTLLVSLLVMGAVTILSFSLEVFQVVPSVAREARVYMWWRLPGLIGSLLFVALRSYLAGTGRVTVAFIAVLLANVVNLGLDVLLALHWKWGAAGAAIATSVCSWFQFAVLLWGLPRVDGKISRRIDWSQVRAMWKQGAPVGFQFVAESALFSLVGVLAAQLGEVPAAAHMVALNWASLSFCVAAGIGSAIAVRVGWAIGARDVPQARQSAAVAMVAGVAFMTASAIVFALVPREMAQFMAKDAAVIETATALFWVVAVFQISDGLQAVAAGALRGAGKTTFAFLGNFIGHWFIGFPLAWFLGLHLGMGVQGLWWGLMAGLTAVAVSLSFGFFRLVKV